MDANKQRFPVLILLSLLLSSCITVSDADTPVPEVDFSVIISGQNTLSGLPENRKIEVFTDQQSLNSILALYVNFVTEPPIDFTSSQAVLLSMGGRSSGGYSIAAEAVEDHGDYNKLKVLLTTPGSNCYTTQALTSPYQFIEIKSTKELLIEERLVVTDCSQ